MKLSRAALLAAVTLSGFFCALPAAAADFTGYVGGIKPGSLTFQGVSTALDSSPVYGFRFKLDFLPYLGHEHSFGFSSGYLVPSSVSAFTNPKGFVYNSNLILGVKIGRAVPFVTAGIGLIHQYGAPALEVGTKFAVNYGGGLNFPRLLGPLGLRFDVRGYTATGLNSGNLSMLEVTGGILLSFGR
jgi:hypothetical protein